MLCFSPLLYLNALIHLVLTVDSLSVNAESSNQLDGQLTIVHLGDSYSAGNGARDENGDRNYIDVDEDGTNVSNCRRSPTNWGSQFAELLEADTTYDVTYLNRACSGAVTQNITDTQTTGGVTVGGVTVGGQIIPPQIDSINADIDLVLISIGGNDIEFNEIVKKCYALAFRSADGCRNQIDNARRLIQDDTLSRRLTNVLTEIKNNLRDDATIVLVSYPHLTLDVEYTLINPSIGQADYEVTPNIRNLNDIANDEVNELVYGDGGINSISGARVIYFDDTRRIFEGHEPHPDFLTENPDRWIFEFETTVLQEWYHYNPAGHENLAIELGQSVIPILPLSKAPTNISLASVETQQKSFTIYPMSPL